MHYLSIAMKIFSVFAVFALTSASALASKKDLVHLVKRACTDTICIRASQTMLDECGVNAATDYDCLCNNMDDDFYEDFYGCTLTCPRASLQGTGITSASEVKDAFCSLVRAQW
ncbi:putative GPI-anchored adhesin-like protein PGA28 [Candida viswanathii]|uniref:Putative GPI-anchored adhesin-like protein PGA28 n=1 Tax=Candida viswanathii TaxID=5486 RepID=A0A367YIE2_9ASCO|nr:putative GPI-anchored adhesin-like protein PGA28 [Candida viswanathii]